MKGTSNAKQKYLCNKHANQQSRHDKAHSLLHLHRHTRKQKAPTFLENLGAPRKAEAANCSAIRPVSSVCTLAELARIVLTVPRSAACWSRKNWGPLSARETRGAKSSGQGCRVIICRTTGHNEQYAATAVFLVSLASASSALQRAVLQKDRCNQQQDA